MSQPLTNADSAPATAAAPVTATGSDDAFDRSTFFNLGGAGMAIGLAVPALAYSFLAGVAPVLTTAGDRLAFALPWMAFPVVALVAGMMAVGAGRVASENIDGSPPAIGTRLEVHRRYMQNTLEQLSIFIPTQLALVTLLPDDRLALIPVWAILFLFARVAFWIGYLRNPAMRSFGMLMTHPNMLALGYVLFQAVV